MERKGESERESGLPRTFRGGEAEARSGSLRVVSASLRTVKSGIPKPVWSVRKRQEGSRGEDFGAAEEQHGPEPVRTYGHSTGDEEDLGAADVEYLGWERVENKESMPASQASDIDCAVVDEATPLLEGHLEVLQGPLLRYSDSGEDVSSKNSLAVDSALKEAGEDGATNDADIYLAMGTLEKAFPERFGALIMTLIVEIPTLLIISGGSDQLCMLVGRRKYQLLLAFLPLTSAISGNVGLQASTLTTRAVSHLHVTPHKFRRWLGQEIGAAFLLGLTIGSAVGIFAYHASGNDPGLGFTVFIAQFVSILTAGLTGTLAPMLFSFVFRRDAGQWGGPLETAIQDIVGSFAMVVLSFHVLALWGPIDIAPEDMCGV